MSNQKKSIIKRITYLEQTPIPGKTMRTKRTEIDVGNKVREIRKTSGFSMKELAEKVGVSVLTIHRVETGKLSPSVVLLSDIAYHLHYPVTAFISEEQHVIVIRGKEKSIIKSDKLKLKIMAHQGEIKDNISVSIAQSDAGEIIGRHKNDGYELTYIIKGKNVLYYGNKKYVVEAGDMVCHDGKDWHSVEALTPTEFLNIYLHKSS